MGIPPADCIASPGILARLKQETAPAHRRLERSLGFSPDTINEHGIRHFLGRLYGFVSVWEPWLALSGLEEGFLAPRRKLHLLRADLQNLGLNHFGHLPVYPGALSTPGAEAAMGALYVMEGSTLGGVLISKWLDKAAWKPAAGCLYFTCYGDEVGRMWKDFQRRLVTAAQPASEDAIVAAANDTFGWLQDWLCEPRDRK